MNVELLLWYIVLMGLLNAVCTIIAGLTEAEKSDRYGCSDFIFGMIGLVVLVVVLAS